MNTELMNLFAAFMEKQEILSKLTEDARLHGYNYSEIHTIAAIGDLEEPNVTQIANYMNVTKGAISKIAKKLLEQGLIEAYQQDGNKQKVFSFNGIGTILISGTRKAAQLMAEKRYGFSEPVRP